MSPDNRAKTMFTSLYGLYQFIVISFGLSEGPATFQRLINGVLRVTESYSCVYLDDVVNLLYKVRIGKVTYSI